MDDYYNCRLAERFPDTKPLPLSDGEVILPADYPKKILCSWQKVMDGEIRGIGMEMHGNPVQLYKTDFCGFILQ